MSSAIIYFNPLKIDPDCLYWKYLANLILLELQKYIDPIELIDFVAEHITNHYRPWREIYEIEVAELKNFINFADCALKVTI